MEIFINELSLHGQYFQDAEFEKAIRNLLKMNQLISNKMLTWQTESNYLLYQSNISPNTILLQCLENISDDLLKNTFKKFLFASLKNWNLPENRLHSSNDIFICPFLDNKIITDFTLAEVAERNLQKPDIQRLIINFTDSIFKNLLQIEVFKNDEKMENPIHLDCLDSKIELEKYLDIDDIIPQSILKDQSRFIKTSFVFRKSGKGTPIYQEIETSYYWYADYFHRANKFHFEVFNAQKDHLGEADLEGNLIPNTADSGKNGKLSC